MALSPEQVSFAMQRLRIGTAALVAIKNGPYDGRVRALEALKKYVKREFKRVARETHPDLHPNDLAKEEEFKVIRETVEAILAMEVPKPVPPRRVVPQQFVMVGPGWGTSTTSASTFGHVGMPNIHIHIRF